MLRRVTRRSWAVIIFLAAVYTSLGLWLGGNEAVEYQLYKWGLLGAALAPLLVAVIYTVTGNRWWANDIGSALIQAKAGIILLAGPLAWVFFFQHGMLKPGFLAWAEVSGPAVVTLAMLRLSYVFLRYHREKKETGDRLP